MCDTFVALPSATGGDGVIFGKNSDREPNEAQALEFYPAQSFSGPAEQVSCTYLKIPQVKETHAVLLSRPFWMWGAEMGANDSGVVIGNEAVFTKMPYSKKDVLTGMDLLRLALERAGTAEQALETIVQLLSDHGQGGVCGYQDKSLVYHNSYIIADPESAWVLETSGHLWAARQVKDFYSISNGLTIGEEFDRGHPDLVETARQKGRLKKGKAFHFADCFSDWFYTTFSACSKRRGQSYSLLEKSGGRMDISDAFRILRHHGQDTYRPDSHFFMNRVCMHAANSLSRNSQSTASLAASLAPGRQTFWASGTSSPCTGIFKPIWLEGAVLPDIGPVPGAEYDPDSLWWQHEMLHRSVLLDYDTRIQLYAKDRDLLESDFVKRAGGRAGDGPGFAVTQQAFQEAGDATREWIQMVQQAPVQRRPGVVYRNYWNRQNNAAGLMV